MFILSLLNMLNMLNIGKIINILYALFVKFVHDVIWSRYTDAFKNYSKLNINTYDAKQLGKSPLALLSVDD